MHISTNISLQTLISLPANLTARYILILPLLCCTLCCKGMLINYLPTCLCNIQSSSTIRNSNKDNNNISKKCRFLGTKSTAALLQSPLDYFTTMSAVSTSKKAVLPLAPYKRRLESPFQLKYDIREGIREGIRYLLA